MGSQEITSVCSIGEIGAQYVFTIRIQILLQRQRLLIMMVVQAHHLLDEVYSVVSQSLVAQVTGLTLQPPHLLSPMLVASGPAEHQ